MIFAERLRPHRVLIAVVAATGALACKDTTTPKQLSTEGITEPRFTASAGFTSATLGRGNLGAFSVHSNADGYKAELKSHDNTDIVVANVTIAPGGHSGWHSHPGPVIVVVKTGTVTFYHANDPTCTGTAHPAGTVFIEEGGDVGIARNEGTVEVSNAVSYFVPMGSLPRIDAADPQNPNCHF